MKTRYVAALLAGFSCAAAARSSAAPAADPAAGGGIWKGPAAGDAVAGEGANSRR